MSNKNGLRRLFAAVVAIVSFVSALLAFQTAPTWVILLTLNAIVFSAVSIFYPQLRALISSGEKIVWFTNRDNATPDMQVEMEKHDDLTFIGISQVSLADYLRPILLKGLSYQKIKWKNITIYFAHDDVGRSWEGQSFNQNLKNARQHIAEVLCDKDYMLDSLEKIAFRQATQPLGYGGSIFGNTDQLLVDHDTIYTVNYLPSPNRDTKKSLTLKISRISKLNTHKYHKHKIFDAYLEAFQVLHSSSKNIGEFMPSVWDWSGMEWSDFCKGYRGMEESTNELIKLAQLNGTENIIDIAGGTGEPAKHILTHIPQGSLTLLEASPGMLSVSKKLLGGDSRVRFALCRLFNRPETEIDIYNQKYDVIFCHQSLASISPTLAELSFFARWCKKYLTENGQVILNAHNGILDVPAVKGYKNWTDPFRTGLMNTLKKKNFPLSLQTYKKHNLEQIKDAFTQNGFELKQRTERNIEISMADRALMWHVPAVMDSIVDVKSVGIPQCHEIVDEVANTVLNMDTMPRTIYSWKFTIS
jgi:ubiquinone/menaquinone biosynthesis C-methylase UbiE